MDASKPKRRTGLLVLILSIPPVIAAAILTAHPSDHTMLTVIRGAAMLGYMYVFLACLSSLFVLDLMRYFGRPYLSIHHTVAISVLTLLSIHGASVVLHLGKISVLLPRLTSAQHFFTWGGPPAYMLIWTAVVAAGLRIAIGTRWRVLHWLIYVAFMLATAHGLLIGTDFRHDALKWGPATMAVIVAAVFINKRLRERTSRGGGKSA
jgi:sulfoxide reductase heme-binding subunit YedZ